MEKELPKLDEQLANLRAELGSLKKNYQELALAHQDLQSAIAIDCGIDRGGCRCRSTRNSIIILSPMLRR